MTNDPTQSEPLQPAPDRRANPVWIILPAVLIVALVLYFVLRPKRAEENANTTAPSVAVAAVDREDLCNEVTIPGEFRPYVEAELNAKVTGYLNKIFVDFGDKAKEGQLLAVLEVPELKDELNASMAAQERAEADYTNAHLIYTRLQRVNREHPDLVAQQDIDTAEAKDSAAAGELALAKADVGKYQTLFGYTQITAPFDGVITGRFADPGALIQAGTSSGEQPKALLRLSDNYLLRLDFPVSVEYVKDIHLGDFVTVRVVSLGNKEFTGKITRFTDRVAEDTRTMNTEIEVENPNLEIVPGMYAVVVLKVQHRSKALAIPIQAVPPGQTGTVYIVDGNSEIEERPITLGLDTPSKYEVVSGLKEGELVLIGSRSGYKPGEKVEPKRIASPATE